MGRSICPSFVEATARSSKPWIMFQVGIRSMGGEGLAGMETMIHTAIAVIVSWHVWPISMVSAPVWSCAEGFMAVS